MHPEWRDYTIFRTDMIARQRDAEAHGFEPTMALLSVDPWPPEWEHWGQPNVTISRLADELRETEAEIERLKTKLREHGIDPSPAT